MKFCWRMSENLCLQWNDFKENATTAFESLREDNDFSDVTLACEDGKQFEAHKVILASSSPFFQNILRRNKHAHPLIYMRGVKSEDLVAIIDFLYCGEANVCQENLESFLAIGEELQLKGLRGQTNDNEVEQMGATKPRKVPVLRKEPKISMFSEFSGANIDNQIADYDYDTSVGNGIMALKSHFTGDLQELECKTNSMMAKTSNRSIRGQLLHMCTLCGKEAEQTQMKNHIEANHLEGISVPCNLCEKTFRSRNSLAKHKTVYHKHNSSPNTNVFQD